MIFSLLGAVPQDGTSVEIENKGLIVKVVEIFDHQIQTDIVSKKVDTLVES